MMVSLHFSQEAGTTRGIRPPPVGSPSFAELETRQPGVKSDSQSRGRQAQKSRATSQRTAIYRRLLIFRIANGNLTIEASSAARGPAIKRSIVECAPARASIPALMIGLRGCMQCQSGERLPPSTREVRMAPIGTGRSALARGTGGAAARTG